MDSIFCKCGRPSHPCYGSRCEDCYANDLQYAVGSTKDIRGNRRFAAIGGEGLLNIETGIGVADRHRNLSTVGVTR